MEETTNKQEEQLEGDVIEIPAGSTFTEQLLRSVIDGYRDGFNEHSQESEIDYQTTITTHKVPVEGVNKDVAFLRIVRAIRPKGGEESQWSPKIIHQEVYKFSGIAERVNPKARWKEQLYVNAIARLISAGLEYAELLQKLKQQEETDKGKPKIEIATELPKPLTKSDEEYKQWLHAERVKEGLETN